LDEKNNQGDHAMPSHNIDPNVFHANTVYKSVEVEEGKIPDLDRNAAEYLPEYKRFTEFYSTASAKDLFQCIGAYAKENAIEFNFDDEEYSATLKLKSGENVVTMRINILKVDEDRHCIEVVKEDGDKFAFLDSYHEIKKFFGF
jgi:hypothetical protein